MVEVANIEPIKVPEGIDADLEPILTALTSRTRFGWQELLDVCATIYIGATSAAKLIQTPLPELELECKGNGGIEFTLSPGPQAGYVYRGFDVEYQTPHRRLGKYVNFWNNPAEGWDISKTGAKPRQIAEFLVQAVQNPTNQISLY